MRSFMHAWSGRMAFFDGRAAVMPGARKDGTDMGKRSLDRKLVGIFILTSTIPLLVVGIFLSYSTVRLMRENTRMLIRQNLKQIDDNMNIMLESYEDLVYQIYTDDSVVEWMDFLNEEKEEAVTVSQLRRYMRALQFSKDYIEAITVISDGRNMITTHSLNPETNVNPWIDQFSMDRDTLYETVSADNSYHIFPTEYATRFAGDEHYLFHIAHRIIDYRDLQKRCGIVVISLDESLLRRVLYTEEEEKENGSYYFLLDEKGRVISSPDRSWIGEVPGGGDSPEDRSLLEFLEERGGVNISDYTAYSYTDEALGWKIVSAASQRSFLRSVKRNLLIIGGAWLLLLATTLYMIWKLTGKLVASVRTVTKSMKSAGMGDLSVRVPISDSMPSEIETVAKEFNNTLLKLDDAQKKEKEATRNQQRAEIRALEAQINPHFLYNTLDTINWMAIDREAFDISNAIGSLAHILRYAISDYDEEVPVKDEVEWLKRYIYLQQYRMKNRFSCNISMDPDVQDVRIHKLLLQPFVENSILHGFSSAQDEYILDVSFREEDGRLKIRIYDNGTGFDTAIVDRILQGGHADEEDREHIGLENAILRFNSYTGGRGKLTIDSSPGEGTCVEMEFPARGEEEQ